MRRLQVFGIMALLLLAGCKSKKEAVAAVYESLTEIDVPVPEIVQPAIEKPDFSSNIVAEARTWIGVPYKYGGEDRGGVDCSGFVMQVFLNATGIKLPRDSRSQQEYCMPLAISDLLPSDLVFFASKAGGDRVSHVGIYIGNDDFIHASGSRGVMVSNLHEPYYERHFHSCGRVPALAEVKSALKEQSAPTTSIRSSVIDAFR